MSRTELEKTGICRDYYGRLQPKGAQGRMNLESFTANIGTICDSFEELYRHAVNEKFTIRRLFLIASQITEEKKYSGQERYWTLSLFDSDLEMKKKEEIRRNDEKSRKLQDAVLSMKTKYGKNSLVRGLSLQEGAMTMVRNNQIGGHKA